MQFAAGPTQRFRPPHISFPHRRTDIAADERPDARRAWTNVGRSARRDLPDQRSVEFGPTVPEQMIARGHLFVGGLLRVDAHDMEFRVGGAGPHHDAAAAVDNLTLTGEAQRRTGPALASWKRTVVSGLNGLG